VRFALQTARYIRLSGFATPKSYIAADIQNTLCLMVTKRRIFYASVASAVAFFVVPAIACFMVMKMPYLSFDGTPDNAPTRGVGIFMLISPIVFVSVAALTFAGAILLQHLKQLRPTVICSVVIAASFGLAFAMVLDRPLGWHDALYYFAGFTALIFATVGLSALVWWKVAMHTSQTADADRAP
jgi:hypothetical protein